MGRYPANKASSPRLKIGKIQLYREDIPTKHRLRGRVESFIKKQTEIKIMEAKTIK